MLQRTRAYKETKVAAEAYLTSAKGGCGRFVSRLSNVQYKAPTFFPSPSPLHY